MTLLILLFAIKLLARFNIFKQITFHVTTESYARVTSKDICLLFIILFLCLFPFFLDFVLFHEALLFLLYCLIDLVYSYI